MPAAKDSIPLTGTLSSPPYNALSFDLDTLIIGAGFSDSRDAFCARARICGQGCPWLDSRQNPPLPSWAWRNTRILQPALAHPCHAGRHMSLAQTDILPLGQCETRDGISSWMQDRSSLADPMAHPSPTGNRSSREGPTSTINAPPGKPIEGRLAVWTPRAATIGCMGLTYWLASRNQGLRGVHALLFPFFGSDVASRSQTLYLVTNLISPVLIWTVEANRDGCSMAKLALQSLAGAIVQISGIERIAPIYYLFSMATWESAASSEGQNMSPEVAKAVLPATLLGFVLPAALVSLVPLTATGVSRSYFNIQTSVIYAFVSAPVAVPVLTTLISKVTQFVEDPKVDLSTRADKSAPGATKSDQSRESFNISGSLRLAYAVSFAMQAAQHLYTFTRNIVQTPRGQRSLVTAVGSLLTCRIVPGQKYSSLALYAGATLGFELYTVWELRRRGKVSNTDATRAAIGVLTGQVLFGPGATYAGLWWWREGVLAKNARSGIRTV